jgi:hypothetical protein
MYCIYPKGDLKSFPGLQLGRLYREIPFPGGLAL